MVLYNFLYKNSAILSSFYAQMFGGLRLKDTNIDTISTQEENKLSGGYSSTYKTSSTVSTEQQSKNQEIDPQEIVMIDTLSILSKNAKSIEDAKNGEIVKIPATIFLLDKALFDLMLPNIADFMILDAPKNQHKQIRQTANLIKKLFSSIRFDPLVFIHSAQDITVGTIKENFLQESIASFHIKHGSKGLDDVYVIGIKEESLGTLYMEDTQKSAADFTDVVKEMIIPHGSYTITPIAIYREIPIKEER